MLSHKGEKLNQVREIDTKFKAQVMKGMCIACHLSVVFCPWVGTLNFIWWTSAAPPLGNWPEVLLLGQIPTHCPHPPPPRRTPVYTNRCIIGARKSVSRNLYIFQQLFSVFLHSPLWLVHEKWQLSQLMIAKTWSLTEEYLARISLLVFCRWLLGVFSLLSDHIGDWNTVCRFCNMLVLFPSDKYIWVMVLLYFNSSYHRIQAIKRQVSFNFARTMTLKEQVYLFTFDKIAIFLHEEIDVSRTTEARITKPYKQTKFWWQLHPC